MPEPASSNAGADIVVGGGSCARGWLSPSRLPVRLPSAAGAVAAVLSKRRWAMKTCRGCAEHAARACPPGSGLKALKLLAAATVVVCHGATLRQSPGRVSLRAPSMSAVDVSEATLSASSRLLLLEALVCAVHRDDARLFAAITAFHPASGTELPLPARLRTGASNRQGGEVGRGRGAC